MVTKFDEEIKKRLPEGIWQDEPDHIHWVDEETKLDCLIVRQEKAGHLCGYVGVKPGHPLYKVQYHNCTLPTAKPLTEDQIQESLKQLVEWIGKSIEGTWFEKFERSKVLCSEGYCNHSPESMFRVHGGITFSGISGGRITNGDDNIWWIGFDCAHSDDKMPMLDNLFGETHGEYRNMFYVINECASLAKQIKEFENDRKRDNAI